ncbi:MAG: APC family permease [Bryobacterales bacterium]|nr:APC family permease [Bryobacterales bacterium]
MSTPGPRPGSSKIVVATTVALSFISFWRGAAIVLNDLASSSFYVGGIAEQAIGKSAPWFIVAVMLFGYAVRSVYMESCGMFVRGGVYVVVRNSMGPFMAKISVSALIVDFVLTGPISSVSAGHYLGRLLNETAEIFHYDFHINPGWFAVAFGVMVTLYFWWANVKGIHESSGKALRIIQIMTVMVVILTVWSVITILVRKQFQLPPPPTPANLQFSKEALGWLEGTFWPNLALAGLIIAFGHSLLAMSGFETLAQVYREIASPKLKNLKITANIVCTYALVSTGLITVFAGMIIPDAVRKNYHDNLIGGLAMNLAGPELLRLIFHAFVVVVGALILSGAVNTSIIGANGILNRVAEDGVLLNFFRKPHRRFGTTSRIINLITILQLAAIIASRGDVYLLGEAYAFGVVWSFFLKGLGVLALRFQRHDQEYKTPFNVRIGGREIPIGLGVTTLMLFFVAIANLLTKQVATIYGVSFTVVMLALFIVSERVNQRERSAGKQGLEEFNLEHQSTVDSETVNARPGCVLVAVREYVRMEHLKRVLEKTNLRRHDIVVMTVRPVSTGAGEYALANEQLFTDYEKELFSHVVTMAEKEGKPVELVVVPALDPFEAMVQTAANLKASRLVTGVSAGMPSDELARRIGRAWERLPEPRPALSLEVIAPGRPSAYVNLGPHPPRLWPEDVERAHEIWLRLTEQERYGAQLHHRDVIGVALRRLERDLDRGDPRQLLEEIESEMRRELD